MKITPHDLERLASFPEQNPNPVIEVTLDGNLTYLNGAARKLFPEIEATGFNHEVFSGVKTKLKHANPGSLNNVKLEIRVGEKIFEQKLYFIEGSEVIRIYSSDITQMKQIEKNLSRLASFPEQNPSPIIEVDYEGNILYFNPAVLIHFPDFYALKFDHPVLKSVGKKLSKFRSGELTTHSEEIRIDDKYFDQRANLIKESDVVRIFNIDITRQKAIEELIKEKNKDITDSINYARKIQNAIMPPETVLTAQFPESFILYHPKDIVSGDFYWFRPAEPVFVIACADCTGHGVPGAFMSMIGINLLSHIVNEAAVDNPAVALQKLDGGIIKSLKQDDESDSADGMDIALCAYNPSTKLLQFAGANRPLILIRNKEILEFSPDKNAIGGKYSGKKEFNSNEVQLLEGDHVYLFTDGYIDQFGGPKGKKFMKRRFLELLLEIHELPMAQQRGALLDAFENWKGDLQQVDDVLLIGIKVS
jgi:serine phosphatase RsbU (regulator of sigma subunit)